MNSISKATVIKNFFDEAFELMGYHPTKLIVAGNGSWNGIVLTYEKKEICDIAPLLLLINDDKFSPARFMAYMQARHFCNFMFKGMCDPVDDYGFAVAGFSLKGLNVTPSNGFGLSENEILERAQKILKDEFCFEGTFKTISKTELGNTFYKFVVNQNKCREILLKLQGEYDNKSVGVQPISGEKGSLENPFDNVDEACDFILSAEKEAYHKDDYLKQLSEKPYFLNANFGQFSIPWASPYVSIRKSYLPEKAFIISSLDNFKIKNEEGMKCFSNTVFSLKPNLLGKKFLFRGQTDHYPGIPCVPNFFRNKKHKEKGDYTDYNVVNCEMQLLIRSLPIVKLLEKGFELKHDKFQIRINYLGLAQHYYNKSHFLDLSSDIEVAKFFATTGYDSKTDSYYPWHDCSKIGVVYYYELVYPAAFQQHVLGVSNNPFSIEKCMNNSSVARFPAKTKFNKFCYALKNIGKQPFLRSGSQSGFLLEMGSDLDFKNLPEVKAVYFKHDPDISDRIFRESRNGEAYFGVDILESAWKNRFRNRVEKKIVSRKAVELNAIYNPRQGFEYIEKNLRSQGFTIDNFNPSFTNEELKAFYADIRQWWDCFCKDIHFADAEDELYRTALKNLINLEEYKWAFFPNLD